MANFMAIVTARTAALGVDVRRDGVAASGRRLVGYASASAHGCVRQAFELSGLGGDALRSITTDSMHRIDAAALRDGVEHRAAFASPAAYLRHESRGLAAGSPWPCDFGRDLSRGFRALKTWFTLKGYGTERIGEMISRTR